MIIRPFGKEQASKFPFTFQIVLFYYANRIDSLRCDMGRLAYSDTSGPNPGQSKKQQKHVMTCQKVCWRPTACLENREEGVGFGNSATTFSKQYPKLENIVNKSG